MGTGARSLVADVGTPALTAPIAVDETRATAFLGGLISLDLMSGDRTFVLGAPRVVTSLASDSVGNRLFAIDGSGRVSAIDVSSRTETTLLRWHVPNEDAPNFVSHPASVDGADRILTSGSVEVHTANGDSALPAIISIDLAHGQRTVLSSNDRQNGENPLDFDGGIAVDTERGRALVTAPSDQRILAVDLQTGLRTVFAQNASGSDEPFSRPSDIVLDREHNRVLVSNPGPSANSIAAVDLDNGASRVFSDAETPNSTNPFISPGQLALDAPHHRLLVNDGNGRIVTVDLATGRRSVVATLAVTDIEFDAERNRILVRVGSTIVAIDAATGRQSTFATLGIGSTPWLLVDAAARIFAIGLDGLVQLSPTTGEQVVLSR